MYLHRLWLCLIFATFTAAQVTSLVSSIVSSVASDVSSVVSEASSVVSSIIATESSASSVASSASSAASSAASAGSSSAASSLSSVASSASSVASSASSAASSISSSISSVVSSTSSSIAPTSSSSEASSSSTSSLTSSDSDSTSPPSTTSTETSSSETFTYSSVSSSVSYQATVYSTANVVVTTQPDGQTSQRTEFTVVQTSVPATTLYSTTLVTSTESPTGVAGLQREGGSGGGSSLSTGAKAGIGAGVGILVVAAAIIGALIAMRRRRKNRNIADSDRYTPSTGPSLYGFGAMGKERSNYTESEMHRSGSPPMRETNPLDRYATPGQSQRASIPANSRTSDISSVSGSEPTAYRPGPGMPAVAEQSYRPGIEELPEQNNQYLHPAYGAAAAGAAGSPFHHAEGDETPSLYSEDGHPHGQGSRQQPPREASPAALELSGENAMGGGQGYRGMDPEQPYHTRSQLTKPMQQGRYDVAHNF